jgi:nitrite reductase (NADH) large subunit
MTEITHAATGVRDVVIVGGGPAAHRLADSLHARDTDRTLRVTVVGEELHRPYDRVALSTRLADAAADLTLQPTSMWDDGHIRLVTGERVTAIDRGAHTATTSGGLVLRWDELVLATGSSAPVPELPGSEHARVYRTIDDVDALVAETRDSRRPTAGPRGARRRRRPARARGAAASPSSVRMPRSCTRAAGSCRHSSTRAPDARSGASSRARASGSTSAPAPRPCSSRATPSSAWSSRTGTRVDADLLVFAIGISPRDELARDLGLELGPRGGVAISTACAASAANIWAIGEVASFEGRCTGLVAPANAMAEVVADRLLGGGREFTSVDDATKLKLSGVDVASFGDALARTEQALEIVYADPARGLYQKLVMTDDATTLLGGIFVGDASPYASLRPLLGTRLSASRRLSLGVGHGGACRRRAPRRGARVRLQQRQRRDDPGRGERRRACRGLHRARGAEGLHPRGHAVRSCVPLVKKLLESELKKSGVTPSRALCEHFGLSARSSSSRSACWSSPRSTRSSPDSAPAAAATSASRWSARSWRPSTARTSSTAAAAACRTRTTAPWPTCRRTALLGGPRIPPVRSRRRSSR